MNKKQVIKNFKKDICKNKMSKTNKHMYWNDYTYNLFQNNLITIKQFSQWSYPFKK